MDNGGKYLKEKFEEAGLAIRVVDRASRVSSGNIFTLSVHVDRNGTRTRETFHLHPGAADVKVLNIDKALRQLVLFVNEPVRVFTTRRWDPAARETVTTSHQAGGRTKYLIGMDERSYFMAPVASTVTTVLDAHRALKPAAVASLETRKNRAGKIVRQGEWFFVPLTSAEVCELEAAKPVIHKKTPIPGAGKPHTADELFHFGENYYARGAVRHLDHKTVHFISWHRVVPNTEIRVRSPFGGGLQWPQWID